MYSVTIAWLKTFVIQNELLDYWSVVYMSSASIIFCFTLPNFIYFRSICGGCEQTRENQAVPDLVEYVMTKLKMFTTGLFQHFNWW